MRLSNKRYEEIKISVAKLYQQCAINSTPINGFVIADKLNIKVVPYSTYPQNIKTLNKYSNDGFFIETTNGDYSIYYNDKKSYGRINYTIMHEIGHIVLGHVSDNDIVDSEAQFFAKYALAPPVLMYKYEICRISEVEKIFGLSNEAAINALKYFDTWQTHRALDFTDYERIIYNQFHNVK